MISQKPVKIHVIKDRDQFAISTENSLIFQLL